MQQMESLSYAKLFFSSSRTVGSVNLPTRAQLRRQGARSKVLTCSVDASFARFKQCVPLVGQWLSHRFFRALLCQVVRSTPLTPNGGISNNRQSNHQWCMCVETFKKKQEQVCFHCTAHRQFSISLYLFPFFLKYVVVACLLQQMSYLGSFAQTTCVRASEMGACQRTSLTIQTTCRTCSCFKCQRQRQMTRKCSSPLYPLVLLDRVAFTNLVFVYLPVLSQRYR